MTAHADSATSQTTASAEASASANAATVAPASAPAATADAARREALAGAERAELYALLQEHFEGVLPEQFNRDLDEKDWVLRIRMGERLIGFTTLQARAFEHEGRHLRVLYSGDTIMSPEGWGSPVLAKGWISLVHRIQAEHPDDPWYWLLLSSGFRTYRFLPVFWREFWPRVDAEAPSDMRALTNALAHDRFGTQYNATAGVVRFDRPQRLRGQLAAIPEGRELDPHVRFFLELNPGHAAGDELVCLAPIHDDNLTAAGIRIVRAVRRG